MTRHKLVSILFAAVSVVILPEGAGHPVQAQNNYSPTCPSGIPSCYQSGYVGLTPSQQHGRDTWYFWTGGDLDTDGKTVVGDQALWRILAIESHGTFDLLQAIDSRYRGQRFKLFGVISDPDCTKATHPDQYGLWLDGELLESRCSENSRRSRRADRCDGVEKIPQPEIQSDCVGFEEISGRPGKHGASLSRRHGLRLLSCWLQSAASACRP